MGDVNEARFRTRPSGNIAVFSRNRVGISENSNLLKPISTCNCINNMDFDLLEINRDFSIKDFLYVWFR